MARLIFALLGLLLLCPTLGATPADRLKYELQYSVEFRPASASALVEIRTKALAGRLIGMDLNMPTRVYSAVQGDGTVQRQGERVLWTPPREGGALRYAVRIDQQRANGEYDSYITPTFVITRLDHLFAPAKIRASKGSGSTARLHFKLPAGWEQVETPFTKLKGGDFAITNPRRNFDRPLGWMAAGQLSATRETIGTTRVTVTAPKAQHAAELATIATVRQVLVEMTDAFGEVPDKLLIVRAGDPMWRGGLSAPESLWLHADRPQLSENGTSPIVHELSHVLTRIRGATNDDWIAEGLAEYYSLEIGRRALLITDARFAKAIKSEARSGSKVANLRAPQSSGDRTRKAVALFAGLDTELRAFGSDLDALTRQLMRARSPISLEQLRVAAQHLEGRPSRVLAAIN